MQNNKVFRLLVSKDVAVATSGVTTSSASDGAIVAFDENWDQLTSSTDEISISPIIYLMQKVVNADAKVGSIMSLPIDGRRVRGYKGESFRPGQEQITYIGLTPSSTTIAAGSGDVTATVGEEYFINILNAEEKQKFQVPSRYYYTLPTGGTKYTLLVEFARQINADEAAVCTARVIGNGTGTDGLTGATAYGLQLKADDAKYFFSVGVSDSFGADVTTDVEMFPGSGTVAQLEQIQEYSQGYMGYLNRIWLTKDITNYVANQADSSLISSNATGTITFTQNSKAVSLSHALDADLAVGDEIVVNGVTYGIAAKGSSTAYTLTEPFRGATVIYTATATVIPSTAKVQGYDLVIVDHDSVSDTNLSVGVLPKPCQTIIAVPSKLANASALTTFLTVLNAWLATSPASFSNVSV